METPKDLERDASAFGGLFQQILNEMKNSSPLWEDLTTKSTKLHACLRATIQAVSAFLDAFQKIADAATAAKGATKDIGTSLTRLCLRHKAIEAKLKTFTNSILDCLIIPLQEKLEEWKKCTAHLDKEHAKEYKKARAELKKRSVDTLRLQKKVRKGTFGGHNGALSSSFSGGTLPRASGGGGHGNMTSSGDGFGLAGNREMHKVLEAALRETAEKKQAFEDAEKTAIRTALVEERSRFCLFVSYLKPVVEDEVSMLSELTHVQEAMHQLEKHAVEPFSLPAASEQVIQDLKGSCDSGTWSFQTPPSSPSSLGSRKSSMCSISSANSSSSGSAHSPTHNIHNRTVLNQPMAQLLHRPAAPPCYSSVSSGDSGFMSQDVICTKGHSVTPFDHSRKAGNQSEGSNTSSGSSNCSTPSSPYPHGSAPPTAMTTWPNLQDSIQFERAACAIMNERPHTISSAYERGHPRQPLTVYTFHPPSEGGNSRPPATTPTAQQPQQQGPVYQDASEIYGMLRGKRESKPPVPKRCSSLERPQPEPTPMGPPPPRTKAERSASKEDRKSTGGTLSSVPSLPDFNQPSADMIVPQPVYVNMHELNQMASAKMQRQSSNERQHTELPPPPPELMQHSTKVAGIEFPSGQTEPSDYASHTRSWSGEDSGLAYNLYGPPSGSGSNSNSSTLTGITTMTTSSGTTVTCDARQNEDWIASLSLDSLCLCFDTTSGQGHSTLPRRCVHRGNCPFVTMSIPFGQQRPHSLATRTLELDDTPMYAYVGRQGSTQSEKPPPPVRRNSSISVSNSNSPTRTCPPTLSESIYSNVPLRLQKTQESQHNGGGIPNLYHRFDSSGETTPHASMEQLPPPPSYLMGHADQRLLDSSDPALKRMLDSSDPALKRMSVAETIKTLTEKNHQPLSPNMVRKSVKQAEDEPSPPKNQSKRNVLPTSVHASKDRGSLIQLLSDKLTTVSPNLGIHGNNVGIHGNNTAGQVKQHNNSHHGDQGHVQSLSMYHQVIQIQHPTSSQSATSSPRHPRRFSEELLKTTATFVQQRVLGTKTPPPVVTSKEIFVQTLNAKLSQMRVSSPPTDRRGSLPTNPVTKTSFASKLVPSVGNNQHSSKSTGKHQHHDAASRVRQWISSKTIADPALVRESLMDQIRRGTKLKHTRTVNDRSAPKVNR